MSSNNNNNGKGNNTFPEKGLPITFRQGNHSRESAELVRGNPKTGSSTRTGTGSSSESERERQFRRTHRALLSQPVSSSSSGSDSTQKAKTDSTKKPNTDSTKKAKTDSTKKPQK